MTLSTLLTEKSDRGVYPIQNDAIFKIFFGSIENYESLVFLLKSLSPYLVIKEVNKNQLKSSSEVIADIHNGLDAIRGNEVHDPFSALRSFVLDINCILSNGNNVFIKMQSSQMVGDSKDNNFADWKKGFFYYLARVSSSGLNVPCLNVPKGTPSDEFFKSIPNTYVVAFTNFGVYEDNGDIFTPHPQSISALEKIIENDFYNDASMSKVLRNTIKVIARYNEIITQNPAFNVINTAAFRFPDGELFSNSQNIITIELTKTKRFLNTPINDLKPIDALLLYMSIAHLAKYQDKINQLTSYFPEIKTMDNNLQRIVSTNAEAIEQIMKLMAELDYYDIMGRYNKEVAEITAKKDEELAEALAKKDEELAKKDEELAEITAKKDEAMAALAKKDRETTKALAKKDMEMAKSIAKTLLELGTLTLEQISKATGLGPEELNKL